MFEVGRLEVVDPREVWSNEATDFTPWLCENADALADAIGLEIELSATEHSVGSFSLDVIGRDVDNDCVLIVENQLEKTDHRHLGQLITYTANTDAGTVIWMATSFREEHRQAISLLNELGKEKVRFFGVEIGAVRIGNSQVAPLFKVVEQPNEFHAQVPTAAKESSGKENGFKDLTYLDFWGKFLDEYREKHPDWTTSSSGQAQNFLELRSQFRKKSIKYGVQFTARGLRCDLHILGLDSEQSEEWFDEFFERRIEIEDKFGKELNWERLPGKKTSRISFYMEEDIVQDVMQVENHDDYIKWFIDTLERLREAVD